MSIVNGARKSGVHANDPLIAAYRRLWRLIAAYCGEEHHKNMTYTIGVLLMNYIFPLSSLFVCAVSFVCAVCSFWFDSLVSVFLHRLLFEPLRSRMRLEEEQIHSHRVPHNHSWGPFHPLDSPACSECVPLSLVVTDHDRP